MTRSLDKRDFQPFRYPVGFFGLGLASGWKRSFYQSRHLRSRPGGHDSFQSLLQAIDRLQTQKPKYRDDALPQLALSAASPSQLSLFLRSWTSRSILQP